MIELRPFKIACSRTFQTVPDFVGKRVIQRVDATEGLIACVTVNSQVEFLPQQADISSGYVVHHFRKMAPAADRKLISSQGWSRFQRP